jgi:Plasmid pRiA4b ORF-3-like protein
LAVVAWMIRWFAVNRRFTAAISAPTVPKEAIAVPESAEGALPSVYQLRIVLRGVSPLVWRRLQVGAEDSIADLHAALQIAFGWDGTHLHRFVIYGRAYGHDSRLDPREVRLCDLGLRVGERFTYEYDFTNDWLHDVRLEAILPAQPGRRYPVLIGGRRSAPPENCGGADAFLELRQQHSGAPLELLRAFGELLDADPGRRIDEILGERYEEFLELCRWTLIDRFDRRAANRQLRDRTGGTRSMG